MALITMRILALDHGERRTGVAMSDPTGCFARPLSVLAADSALLGKIRELVLEHQIGEVVVGLPLHMSGAYGRRSDSVLAFVESLRVAIDIPVLTWDERLTTVQAARTLRELGKNARKAKRSIDAIAAVHLLQNYLDGRRYRTDRTLKESEE